jgi:LysR family glycine cleavage system transcriptional activator
MKRLPPLNALRAFHVAAQKGSFTKAGVALHVTQGAISRQVKLLEDVMGRPLFFRVHQGIKLTETGKLLAEGLQTAFDGLEQLIECINSDQRRFQIAINIPPTFATRWLAPRLSRFCNLYPFVDFQITTNWVQSVRDSEAHDCLVLFDLAPWTKVDCELLMLEKHVMVSHPGLWTNDWPPTLSKQTLLHILNGTERLPVWERWITQNNLSHINPQPGVAFSTLDQVINAAISRAGVAIVDQSMIRPELASGVLRRFNDLHMDGPYGYWFVDVAKDDEHKAVVRLFREWLKQEVADSQAEVPAA